MYNAVLSLLYYHIYACTDYDNSRLHNDDLALSFYVYIHNSGLQTRKQKTIYRIIVQTHMCRLLFETFHDFFS